MGVGYLNEVYPRPQFSKSLDLQMSSLVGNFKKISVVQYTPNAFMNLFTINGA